MTETKPIGQEDKMPKPGTTQLSMMISPELKVRAKMMAIRRGLTLTDLVVEYIETWLSKDEKE